MEEEQPSLVARFQSTFIDTLLIITVMMAASFILDSFANVPDWVRVSITVSVFLVYEPVCMVFGCTLGNYIKNIRVKRFADTTSRINFLQAIIRYLLKILLGWLSFVRVHTNSAKRAIHDLISGSVMVKV